MKSNRSLSFLFGSSAALVIVLVVVGCSKSGSTYSSISKPGAAVGAPPFVPATAVDESRNVEIKRGATLTVKLEADPAKGHNWSATTMGNGVLTQEGQPVYSENPAAVARASGGVETWVFRAMEPGHDEVRFESRQASKQTNELAKGVTFYVNVR